MKTKLRPLGDRLLIQRLETESTTKSGIVLPDSAKEKPQQAKVISVGSGRLLDDGKRAPMSVKKGDTIILSKWGGTEIKLDGEDCVIIKEDDVLAVVE